MYGYHELNNTVKHLICRQSTDNCIYAKNAHFSWEHYDPTDVYDLPSTRLKLARNNVGMEIMSNASGSRKYHDSNRDLALCKNNEVK